jgi:hypothetical protein
MVSIIEKNQRSTISCYCTFKGTVAPSKQISEAENLVYCPFKTSQKPKPPDGKKKYISSYSAAKNIPKIAEVKLSSCGLEVADFRKNCDCGVAVAAQHFLKSCVIVIAEVLPSTCGIAIADSKKRCVCPPLTVTKQLIYRHCTCTVQCCWSTSDWSDRRLGM